MSRFSSFLAGVVLVAGLTAGCRDQSIKAYRVPREALPELPPAASAPAGEPVAAPDMASTPVPTATGEDLVWTAPASWQVGPPAAMRKGTYLIPGEAGASAELAITAFPGDVGGDLANVNRWRGQIQLPPITAAELPAVLDRFQVNGLDVAVVDLLAPSGNPPQRVLGAIVPFRGSTWFFKVTGPAPLVAQEKESILAFLRTLRAP